MSAIDERAVGVSGKSTQDGSGQLSVGTATRATLPHLRYGSAVHAALGEMTLLPDTLEAGMRTETPDGQRELFLRLEWLPGHDDLVPPAIHADGLIVQWSHLIGWSVRSGNDLDVLDADELADPAVIADAAMHAALCGLRCACEKQPAGRWDEAVYLDVALVAYDERTTGAAL